MYSSILSAIPGGLTSISGFALMVMKWLPEFQISLENIMTLSRRRGLIFSHGASVLSATNLSPRTPFFPH